MTKPRKMRDGTWRARVDGPTHPSGKRRQVTVREANKADAMRRIIEIQQQRLAAEEQRASGMILGEQIEGWKAQKLGDMAPKTAATIRSRIETHFRPDEIWSIPLEELDERHIAEFGRRLQDKPGRGGSTLTPQTRRHIEKLLRQILDAAKGQSLIGHNPARNAPLPKVRKDPSTIRAWTTEEISRYMNAMASSTAENSKRWLYFFCLMLTTGLRRGEAAGLRRENVNLGEKLITISETRLNSGSATSRPKTVSSGRTIALSPQAAAFLEELRAIQDADRALFGSSWIDSGFVMTLPDGRPPSPDAITRRFRRDCERFGLPYIRVHGLRHTFATQALRARVPFHVVSRILGHSSVTVTLETYAHLVSGDDLRAMTEIADSILGEPPTDEI